MTRPQKPASLIPVAVIAVVAIALLILNRTRPQKLEPPANPTTYRPAQDTLKTQDEIDRDSQLLSNALEVIHEHYGQNTKITVSYVSAAASYVEINMNGTQMGGDASYAWRSTMYSHLCKLDSKRVIVNVVDGFGWLMDYHAIEVFRGNRKPVHWDEDRDYPWKRNREAYGAGLTTDEDIAYETARVEAIARERGFSPSKQSVQPGGAHVAPSAGAPSGHP